MPSSASPLRWTLLAVTVGFTFRCGFNEDELQCDQAVAKLASCCPGFDWGTVACREDACGVTNYPAITVAEAHCIRNESCEQIRATNVCDRAWADKDGITVLDGDGGRIVIHSDGSESSPVPVCP